MVFRCSIHGTIDPDILAISKSFGIRFEWPGEEPLKLILKREEVAHNLMHTEMNDVPSKAIEDDVSRMMRTKRRDIRMLTQGLFYLCIQQDFYKFSGGVPVVDFCRIQVIQGRWIYAFGRMEAKHRVRMIESITVSS